MYYKHRILSREEELEYFAKYHAGSIDAFHVLVESQIGWANKLAVKFCKRVAWKDIDIAISAAHLGIMHAIRKFDTSKGIRLVTYSRHWIEQYLRRCSKQERELISIPTYLGLKSEKNNPYQKFTKTTFVNVDDFSPITDKDTVSYDELLDEVKICIKELTEREQFVLHSLFYEQKTLKATGKILGITRERVRQIREESLGKIRKNMGINND